MPIQINNNNLEIIFIIPVSENKQKGELKILSAFLLSTSVNTLKAQRVPPGFHIACRPIEEDFSFTPLLKGY